MKIIIISTTLLLLLASCGAPTPPAHLDKGKMGMPVDTVMTIEMEPESSSTDSMVLPISSIEIGEDYLSIVSNTINIDRIGSDIKHLELFVKDGDITGVVINHEKTTRSEPKPVPFEWLGNDRIQVKHGATLELIARYYGTNVETLLVCNQLTSSHIVHGQILKVRCCTTCN